MSVKEIRRGAACPGNVVPMCIIRGECAGFRAKTVETSGHLPITLQHPTKPGNVTVPNHAHVIIKIKTLESILEQAGLTADELRLLL